MSHRQSKFKVVSILTFAALPSLAGGCAKEKEVEEICAWVLDPSECAQDETAGEDGDTGDYPPSADPCVTKADGQPRTVHQCVGEFSASIEFTTVKGNCAATLDPNSELCQEWHPFGPLAEPYEMPAVMACCEVTDVIDEDLYKMFCGADLIEQICASIPQRLQFYIDQGAFPIGENQAQKLQNHLALNQQECYDAFYHPNADTPGVFGPVSWLVKNGDNSEWNMLENFTITLNSAAVNSVWLPAIPEDYQECYDNDFNNTEWFEDAVPPSSGINEILYLTEAATSASMVGPVVEKGRVTGVGGLSSQAGSCVNPWCSLLEVTVDDSTGFWTLEELNLYADGAVSFTNGSARLNVERGAIRLYQVALGNVQADRRGKKTYTVQAGEAGFVVSGTSGFASDLRWARNASPITMHETATGWLIDSFVIEHIDRAGERWTVTIPRTSWD